MNRTEVYHNCLNIMLRFRYGDTEKFPAHAKIAHQSLMQPKIDTRKQFGLTDARPMERSKKTSRDQFLEDMNSAIPWRRWLVAIESFYPKANRGRRRIRLKTMLSIHLLFSTSSITSTT